MSIKGLSHKKQSRELKQVVAFLREAYPEWTTKIPQFVLGLFCRVKVEDFGKYSVYTAYMF